MKTLEEILVYEKEHRHEGGEYGIAACKESIKITMKYFPEKTLYELLGEYVERANGDVFFNRAMILACWEMINER